ncbi:WD40 repeat domain-containing protein [Paenibacillus sp. CC-CFT747]|nr:WD40 repeat domain-containing protein [Paenibacillus sp. CC-CFT747]
MTGEVHFSAPLAGLDVVWAVTVGSDGNAYIAGTLNGVLYRYNPKTQKLDNLGVNPSNKWVWDLDASTDGKIYGSTYPGSKAFVYDTGSGSFTDLGTLFPGQDYVRGGGVTDRYFYAGIGPKAHLIRVDRQTGEKTEIPLSITGTDNFVSNVWSYGGKLLIAYGTSLLVLNESDYSEVNKISWDSPSAFDGMISPPSPYDADLVYYRNKNTGKLWTYRLSTNEANPVASSPKLFDPRITGMNWVTVPDGPQAGRQVLVMLSNNVELAIYDPAEGTVTVKNTNVSKSGIPVQSMETGPDGKLYIGGYTAAMSIYDTAEGVFEHQELEPSQIEGMGSLNGKMYFGIYGGAAIYRYDPKQPFQLRTNPGMIYDIGEEQDRPFAFASGDNKLFIGTIPDYGHLGGALTIYDEAQNRWTTYRNLISNQSIIGVAYANGKVYGGSSILGGLGIDPTATQASMFEFDVASGTKTAEWVPVVPGFSSPQMIGELKIGPDHLLWGIMWGKVDTGEEGFALFAMNPATRQVVKSRVLTSGDRASMWRPFYIRWGQDGLLYTTIGRRLTVFDPSTLASRQLVNESVSLMSLGPDGSIYYALDAKLMKMTPRMTGATLETFRTELNSGRRPSFACRCSWSTTGRPTPPERR